MLDARDHMVAPRAPSTERDGLLRAEPGHDDSVDDLRGERHVAPPIGYHRRALVDVPAPDFEADMDPANPSTVTQRDLANAIRALAMDAVEKAQSGHPGLPMGMADAATVLFQKFLKFDPAHPHWPDRDR